MLDERIIKYLNELNESDREICSRLTELIIDELSLAENKLWHGHPVWFINDNPITGFSIQKKGVRLMFWSGADFEENQLSVRGQKFKDASIFYTAVNEINSDDLRRWLQKSILIQWDYKNLIKRKGQLTKLTP
jgi:hypothetical protein